MHINIDLLKKGLYLLFFVSLISAGVALYLYFNNPYVTDVSKKTSISKMLAGAQQKEPDKHTISILFLGYGGAGHSGGGLADAQVLANIDTQAKTVQLIAVPRDSWVNLPVRSDQKQHHKINMAFAIGNSSTIEPLKDSKYSGKNGGGALAKVAVEIVTGIKPDYYAAVDFDRFVRSIDALGGVTVDVPVSFEDHFFPVKGLENESCGLTPEFINEIHQKYSGFELEKQFECRYETLTFSKGPTQMDGETALKFIRSRHSDTHGGDFARGVREQAMLLAIKDKLLSLDAIDKVDDFYSEFRRMIVTDIDQNALVDILLKVGDVRNYKVTKFNISTDNYLNNSTSSDGQYILIPKEGLDNWETIHQATQKPL